MKFNLNKTYVVSDFDRTITNEGLIQSWATLDASGLMSEEYVKARNALHKKYRPIECDTTISEKQRNKHIVTWFKEHLKLLLQSNLTEQTLAQICKQDNLLKFRDGAKEFLQFLHKNNVPLVIISAGISNVIEGFLKAQNVLFDNIFIIGNQIEFKNGVAVGFKNKIIHSHNKNKVKLSKQIKSAIKNRHQILLLGDSPHDADMVSRKKRKHTHRVLMYTSERANDMQNLQKLFDEVANDFNEILMLF